VVPKKIPVKKDPNHPQTILPWTEEVEPKPKKSRSKRQDGERT
jgi:hypothetical protein